MTRERPAGDTGARRAALDTSRSFIVQSPAGSGKTELLIQRHLALLATVEAPEEVVAITFTRKATGEMRGRVLDALASADGPPPEDAHARQTYALARTVAHRDRARGWQLRANPARLRIHTIDGLCARLARQMPWLSRFSAETQPVDDPGPLYREAARRSLALIDGDTALSAPVATLLAHLDNDLERFESMLESMLARRDQWLKFLAAGRAGEAGFRHELEAALGRAADAAVADLHKSLPQGLAEELLAVARYAGGNIRIEDGDAPLARLADLQRLPERNRTGLDDWQAIAGVLLTREGKLRKQMDKRVGIPADKTPTARAMKERATALLAALSGEARFQTALEAVRGLPPPVYTDDQWLVLTALLEVLRYASGLLRVVFAEAGRVDFIELVSAARLALGDEEAPTDLALALDYRIAHILVDEFQDTSHSQFQLLNLLTAGWTPEDGRTLFLVGDPMQSIYRFREADVGVFLRAWHQGLNHVRLHPLSLTANFRSRPAIVDWVNGAFPQVFPCIDDESSGAVAYRPANAARGAEEPGGVMVHALMDADEDAEAACAVECVKQSLEHGPDGSVAVLVRSRSHLRRILPRLEAAGIPYRGVELRSVLTTPAVHDLLSLTRALVHRADRVAWLAVLRAPWCGLRLEDLAALAEHERDRSIPELLADSNCLQGLSADGRGRLERVAPVLLSALRERDRKGLRRQVEGVWQALGGPACTDRSGFDDALACLDLIESYEAEQRVVDTDALADRLGKLYAAPAVPDAVVEVMTIHKAKGLEFDTVVVPALDRKPPAGEKRLLAWTQRAAGPTGTDLLLAPLPRDDADEPPLYDYLNRVERNKHRLESARLIYVAATRARRHLHLVARAKRSEKSGGLNPPPGDSLLAHLWPLVQTQFMDAGAGVAAETSPPPAAGPVKRRISRLPAGWMPPAPAPEAGMTGPFFGVALDRADEPVLFEWAGFSVRHAGTVVHELLKRIADEGAERWGPQRVASLAPWARRRLAAEGLADDALESSVARVIDAVSHVLADTRGRWILSDEHRDAHSELAISGILDGQLINVSIDRTFIDQDGVRWIVDYKSGRHEGANTDAFLDREQLRYAPQLERYARLMSACESRAIRVGLYFPLLRGWREWTPDSLVKT